MVHCDDIILNAVGGMGSHEALQRSLQVAADEADRLDVSKSIVNIFNSGAAPDFVASLVESKPEVIDVWIPPDFRMPFLQELRARNEMVFFALQDSDSWVIERNSLRAERDWWFGQFHMLRGRKSVRIALAITNWLALARGLIACS